jgi:hypothetical protein
MWRMSAIWLASTLALAGAARASETAEPHPAPAKPACLPASETREEIKAHHLIEPFAALKSAQAQYKAEPLSAKLCRVGDEFIYEIALLHRDGHYVHVWMNADTGKWLEAPHHGHEAAPRDGHEATPRETPAKP